jgi:DEAD/DEAH box helicase domain-containing protein
MIYRRKEVQREGQSRYETFTFEYERPAVSAISELAPENKFYAGGRRVMVDQIDLSVSEIETWRFCTQCSFHEMDTQASGKSACPHCGSPLWADAGQKRQMVRMRQVFATTADRESRIGDDNDDRDPSFYNKQMMIRYNEADITDAFCIDSDEFPFGFEFLKRVSLREVNFGEKGELGENVVIAGVESRRKGFVICKFCGKVQNRKNEIQHALWCPARKKDDENNLSECVYLYREFSSEAVLILLPISTFEGSERKLHSFVAALHMGLKQTFGGSIDHLQTALHEEPAANSKYRKKYLVLYDTVPGGTGYLKQLMRSEAPLFAVFEKALETLSACPCNQDPAKDGCYRCLFAYRRSYTMGGTSREAAKSLLSEILKHRARLVRTGSLKGVQVNALFDSELEARFVEALRRVRVDDMPARLTKEVVNGKPGYFYRVGRKAYYIELQVPLGASVGVTVPSRADFVFRPARIQDGTRPVAVFTDGFYYHKDRVGLDMAQRTSIARSGNFHVWSLSWKDIENRYKDQGGYFHNYLSIDVNDRALKYSRVLDFLGAEKIAKLNSTDSFDWLIRFLADPDVKRWCCHSSVHSLLHLDMTRFGGNAEKAGWAAKLRDHFPEEISEWIGDLEEPCLYGLFEPENDFIKLFVAIGQDHFKKGDFSGLHAACCLLDGPREREKQAFESAWNGYLRCYNLFQFLEKAFFSTWQGKASGQPHGKPKAWDDIKTDSGSDAWREARELTDPKLHPFMDHLAAAGWDVPEIGFELVDPMGAVIAEAELAWPELTICVLDAEQRIHGDAFSNAGWRVHEIEAVMAAPEGFTQEHEPDLK